MAVIDLNTAESQTVDHTDAETTIKSNRSSEHDIDATATSTSSTNTAGSKGGRKTRSSRIDPEMLAAVEEICDDSDERKAKLCCGSCCDHVRACLIVDSIYLFFMILILIADYTDFVFFENVSNIDSQRVGYDFDDDDDFLYVGDDDDAILNSSGHGVDCFFCTSTFQAVCGIVFVLIGFTGVIRFWKYLVLLHGVWLCSDAVLYCVYQNWPTALCIAAYSYPHFALFFALKSGKITVDNYTKTEQYCCFFDRITEDDDDDSRR